jgi:hypothetical protein
VPKVEKVLSPKQKDRTTILKKKSKTKGRNYFNQYLSKSQNFQLVSYLVSKFQVSIKISIDIISFDICFKKGNYFKNPLES